MVEFVLLISWRGLCKFEGFVWEPYEILEEHSWFEAASCLVSFVWEWNALLLRLKEGKMRESMPLFIYWGWAGDWLTGWTCHHCRTRLRSMTPKIPALMPTFYEATPFKLPPSTAISSFAWTLMSNFLCSCLTERTVWLALQWLSSPLFESFVTNSESRRSSTALTPHLPPPEIQLPRSESSKRNSVQQFESHQASGPLDKTGFVVFHPGHLR